MTAVRRKKRRGFIKPTIGERIFDAWNIFGLILLSLFCFYPLWFSIIMSFNDGIDALRGGIHFWPRVFSLDSYRIVFRSNVIMRAFFISVARTVTGAPLTVFFSAMIGYAWSKNYLVFRKGYMYFGMFTMFFGAGLFPFILLMRTLRLYNTFWVYIIPGMTGFFTLLLFISFFKSLPDSLEEAARIDGCSDFRVFIRIVLPLSKPILATIGLFAAVRQWNSWFDGLVMVRDRSLQPMQTYLYRILTTAEAQNELARQMMEAGMDIAERAEMHVTPSLRFAMIIVTMIPILCTYPFLQKHFTKGVMIGSIKG